MTTPLTQAQLEALGPLCTAHDYMKMTKQLLSFTEVDLLGVKVSGSLCVVNLTVECRTREDEEEALRYLVDNWPYDYMAVHLRIYFMTTSKAITAGISEYAHVESLPNIGPLTEFKFDPDYCVHPGATLQDYLEDHNMTVTQFQSACKYMLSISTIRDILSGVARINHHTACALAEGTETDIGFWVTREREFRTALTQGKQWVRRDRG